MSEHVEDDDSSSVCDSPGSLVEFVVGDDEEEEEEEVGEDGGDDDEAVPEFPYEQEILAQHMQERSGPRRSLRSRKAPERYIDTIQDRIASLYLEDVPEAERDVALHQAVEEGEQSDNDSEYSAGADDADDDDDDDDEEPTTDPPAADQPAEPAEPSEPAEPVPENREGSQKKKPDGQQRADQLVL